MVTAQWAGKDLHGKFWCLKIGLTDGFMLRKSVRFSQPSTRTKLTLAVALARYQAIIDTPESGELDYDSVDPGATKPTKAAIRVNDLLETITGMSVVPDLENLIDKS